MRFSLNSAFLDENAKVGIIAKHFYFEIRKLRSFQYFEILSKAHIEKSPIK